MNPDTCPNCGADVPPGASACPECGADESAGWAEDAYASRLGLPDDSFDYEDFTKREFSGKKPRPYGISWFWWIVAIVMAVVFTLGFVFLRR